MWDPSQSGEASARISFGNSFELPEIEGRVAGIRNWDDLPETLRDRCQTIDALLRGAHAPHCRVRGIGNGPRPEDVVIRTRA